LDVDRLADDSSVLTLRQGPHVEPQQEYHGLDTVQVADLARELAEKQLAPGAGICVDGAGLGAGVVDILKRTRFPVVDVVNSCQAVDYRQYANVRAEIHGRIKDWMKTAALPHDQVLREELVALEYGLNRLDQIQLESKDDLKDRIGRSPDRMDSLTLTFAIDVTLKPMGVARPRARPVQRRPWR
jgi:hypothetical protein